MESILEQLETAADTSNSPSFIFGQNLEAEYGDIYIAALLDLTQRLGVPAVIPEGLVFVITHDFVTDADRILKELKQEHNRAKNKRNAELTRTFSWFGSDKMYFAILIDHKKIGTGIVNGSYLPPRSQWEDLNTRLPNNTTAQDIFEEYLLCLRAVAHEIGHCRDDGYRLIPFGQDYFKEMPTTNIAPEALHNSKAIWSSFYCEYYAYLSIPQETANEKQQFENTKSIVLDYLEKGLTAHALPIMQFEKYVTCSQSALKAVAYEIGRLQAMDNMHWFNSLVAEVKEKNATFAVILNELSETLEQLLTLKAKEWKPESLDSIKQLLDRGFKSFGVVLDYNEAGQLTFNKGEHSFVS